MSIREFFARLRGRQKAYIWTNGKEQEIITTIFTNSVPDVGEKMCIFDGNEYHHYEVKGRYFGINTPSMTACWNLYVEEVFPVQPISESEIEELIESLRRENEEMTKQ
jgi:hypothetical protein